MKQKPWPFQILELGAVTRLQEIVVLVATAQTMALHTDIRAKQKSMA
jgi:hypothetical protein